MLAKKELYKLSLYSDNVFDPYLQVADDPSYVHHGLMAEHVMYSL
jgi:hypothetical protein